MPIFYNGVFQGIPRDMLTPINVKMKYALIQTPEVRKISAMLASQTPKQLKVEKTWIIFVRLICYSEGSFPLKNILAILKLLHLETPIPLLIIIVLSKIK